jgi:hypothetical protein
VAAVIAAGDLAVMALELPTGWFADRYGHRRSLILGSAVQVAGMLACWLADGVSGLVAANVLVALGDAFRSGAGQALLYRSCVAIEREDAFQRIEARTNAAEAAALLGLLLAGGLIVNRWGFAAGWLAESLWCGVGLVIACAMTEPPALAARAEDTSPSGGSRAIVSTTLLVLVVPSALIGAAASAGSFLAQTMGDADATALTTLVALITLTEVAGSFAATRISNGGIRRQLTLAAAAAVITGVAIAVPSLFHVALLALSFLGAVAEPLRDAAIQSVAADNARARAASLASACDMALSTLLLPVAGVWRSRRANRSG